MRSNTALAYSIGRGHITASLNARPRTRPMSRETDAQLLRELLVLYDHNVSALARDLRLRRETIARWRDQKDALELFEKNRILLHGHLINKRGW